MRGQRRGEGIRNVNTFKSHPSYHEFAPELGEEARDYVLDWMGDTTPDALYLFGSMVNPYKRFDHQSDIDVWVVLDSWEQKPVTSTVEAGIRYGAAGFVWPNLFDWKCPKEEVFESLPEDVQHAMKQSNRMWLNPLGFDYSEYLYMDGHPIDLWFGTEQQMRDSVLKQPTSRAELLWEPESDE